MPLALAVRPPRITAQHLLPWGPAGQASKEILYVLPGFHCISFAGVAGLIKVSSMDKDGQGSCIPASEMVIGQWQQLLAPLSDKGGTEFGAEVSPKRYGLWKANGDGTYLRQKGRVAKLITASVLINAKDAPRVSRLLEKIIDIPVAVEASDLPQYGHISTVGFVTGTVRAERATYARVNIKVEGNV